MPFGGLAPLPFRLGASTDGGITAAEHARACADLCAVSRVSPVARLRVRVVAGPSSSSVYVLSYEGANGSGLRFAPLVEWDGTGPVYVRIASYVNALGIKVDLASKVAARWIATVTRCDNGDRCALEFVADGYTVAWFITGGIGITTEYDIKIWGRRPVAIGDYGGHIEKRDSKTEGASTYAWQWYQYLKKADGSAYSQSDTSVRSWELRAEARVLGLSQRISEMLAASATPGGSDLLLERWARQQQIQIAGVARWVVRAQCELKFADRNPPTNEYIEAGLRSILGSVFNSIVTDLGTFDTPPAATYAPGYVHGSALYDLGPGVWSSSRAHITIVVNRGTMTDAELADLMSREAAQWLDVTLPATKTWSWSASAPGGFLLGTSKLGIDSL